MFYLYLLKNFQGVPFHSGLSFSVTSGSAAFPAFPITNSNLPSMLSMRGFSFLHPTLPEPCFMYIVKPLTVLTCFFSISSSVLLNSFSRFHIRKV